MIEDFLKVLHSKEYRPIFAHHRVIKASASRFSTPHPPLNAPLLNSLKRNGINELYDHQVQALELVRQGKNPVLITPTASGKTLCYNLPVLERFLKSNRGYALYLFPLKALEQDQKKQLELLTQNLPQPHLFRCAIYDGDTPPAERARIREELPRFLLTNPEMLHLAISNFHRGWDRLLRNLEFIVIDELHTYKGIFGSHMAQLFRRLERICGLYGANPQYIASSATIANPEELAQNLTGKPFVSITESGAPSARRHFIFLNPEISVLTVTAKLFRLGLSFGLKTIVFTKARKITELIYQRILEDEPELKDKISPYRAGFLPEERREIESKLNTEEFSGVIATSALEMGIDIGSLDLCILVGYPGTISATFQRGGRVGRRSESMVILIGQPNALDQYFMRNPEDFFGRSFESAVIDKDNRFILKQHIWCAAAELPIKADDFIYPPKNYQTILDELVKEGALKFSESGSSWISTDRRPHRNVDLRASGLMYTISNMEGNIIGSIGGANVFSECHPGAIYLHWGKQYLVQDLDLNEHNVVVKYTDVPYYTVANSQKNTEIIRCLKSEKFPNFTLNSGEIKVTEWITGYEKRRLFSQELVGKFALDLPEQSYITSGIWMEIPALARIYCEREKLNFMGGLHGLEHLLLALVPLFALCDRGDMGGVSFVEHLGARGPAIFLYDGYPGGVGLSERVFEVFGKLLEKASAVVKACPCEEGCPSCIHSPRCGSGNYPLDKDAVLSLLEFFTQQNAVLMADTAAVPEEKPATMEEIEELTPVSLISQQTKIEDKKMILIFDLETQLSAEEVGGWGNIAKMRLAVGVILELNSKKFRIYYEEDADSLIKDLEAGDLVIGFNLKRFDYTVLKMYGLENPGKIKTLDLMEDVTAKLGFRLSLNSLCSATLNEGKTGDGLQALKWFKQGELDKVTYYCQKDVELTRDLFLFGHNNGYVLFKDNKGRLNKVPVNWRNPG